MNSFCIKSVPVADLEVVALVHVYGDYGMEDRIVELEVLNDGLRGLATFSKLSCDVYRCDCCGHSLKYACEVVHKPTLQGYYVGRDCAGTLESLAGRDFEGLSVALAQRAKARRARRVWATNNPQHAAILEWAESADGHHIAKDIAGKISRYGDISEKQVELLYTLKKQVEDRAAAKASEPKPTTPAPEGRQTVSGLVLSTKVQETDFGTTHKMLVRLDDHNKVWCSVPGYSNATRGCRITFKATFERSKDDPHFSFGKRPICKDGDCFLPEVK